MKMLFAKSWHILCFGIQLFVGFLPMNTASAPVQDTTSGGTPSQVRKVVIVGGTHGNEYTGVWCIKSFEKRKKIIQSQFPSLELSTLLSNPQAHLQNKRFVDTDLNREFSHEKLTTTMKVDDDKPAPLESLRAREIDQLLGPKFPSAAGTDVCIDLHTTTSNMGTTLIFSQGDPLMAQAAAYAMHKCGGEDNDVRCIMMPETDPNNIPYLPSIAKHSFTIEVGPVPQGVLRHDVIERTDNAMMALLEFLHRYNSNKRKATDGDTGDDGSCIAQKEVIQELNKIYGDAGIVPCYRSAKNPDGTGVKLGWPSDPDNPNFPNLLIHKSVQDQDFKLIKKGDPLFVDLDESVIPYDGLYGDEIYLAFINEGGYYYSSSGTGISVIEKAKFNLHLGKFATE